MNRTLTSTDLVSWESRFQSFLTDRAAGDSSHGLDHVQRVVAGARRIGIIEQARPEIYLPAAWLHDCVHVEKSSPDRHRASTLAADEAVAWLQQAGYPAQYFDVIHHAIRAHSFSAGIPPETIEARVVQDADRLDALGAIGLARCLMVGERLGLPLYHPEDPFSTERTADDNLYILDHFYVKLFTLPDTMQTESGRTEARRRVQFLQKFIEQLETELPVR